jgi:hypothetical protein
MKSMVVGEEFHWQKVEEEKEKAISKVLVS